MVTGTYLGVFDPEIGACHRCLSALPKSAKDGKMPG